MIAAGETPDYTVVSVDRPMTTDGIGGDIAHLVVEQVWGLGGPEGSDDPGDLEEYEGAVDAALAALNGYDHTVAAVSPDGGLLATASLVDKGEGVGQLFSVAAMPERQRRGLGRAVVGAIESAATAQGMSRMDVDGDVARGFYQKLGYADEHEPSGKYLAKPL